VFKIHKQYGPGLFESVYEEIFCYEWTKNGIPFQRQHAVPLIHEEIKMEAGYRADLIVENKVILEIKCVECFNDVHIAQILTYLKLSGCKAGLLLNFKTTSLRHGIRRFVL
jgi:GxxExxY protein